MQSIQHQEKTSSVFHTITRSSQDVGLRGEMSTCSLDQRLCQYNFEIMGEMEPSVNLCFMYYVSHFATITLAMAYPWGTCPPRAQSCPARCQACPGCTELESQCVPAPTRCQPDPANLTTEPFWIFILVNHWMIKIILICPPLVSHASDGGLPGSTVPLEL